MASEFVLADNPLCAGHIKKLKISTQAFVEPRLPITVITLNGIELYTHEKSLRNPIAEAFYRQSFVQVHSSDCRTFGAEFTIFTVMRSY